jgi:hypothetical protein
LTDKTVGGTIWADGIHNVYLGGKPTRVSSPQYGVFNAYKAMQKGIDINGGIPLGIDHLPQEVLDSNPILAETLREASIDPYDVGQIKAISLEGDHIEIKDSNITNPTIQKLYNEGKLPAFSIVGIPILSPCTSGKADVIVDDFSQISRVDFVMAGGCKECTTNSGFLTAKLSQLEESNMTDEIKDEKLKTEEIVEEEVKIEEVDKVEVEDTPLTLADVKQAIMDIVTPLFEGANQKVEAKLATIKEDVETETQDLQLQAKSAKIETLLDAKIASGFATPAMKEGLLLAALSLDDKGVTGMLDSLKTMLWEPEKELNAGNPDDDDKTKISIDDMRAARKAQRF